MSDGEIPLEYTEGILDEKYTEEEYEEEWNLIFWSEEEDDDE